MIRALALLALAACDGGAGPAPSVDAPVTMPDAPNGFGTTCTGSCRTTLLTATFGADTRTLDRAIYGVTRTTTPNTLHVEIHKGGDAGCPTQSSPTPAYTVILGKVAIPTSAAAATSPGNLLDFTGDLLDGPLGAAATTVTITPVAADVCDACAKFISLDVTLAFAAGMISGHVFATHCASLDG